MRLRNAGYSSSSKCCALCGTPGKLSCSPWLYKQHLGHLRHLLAYGEISSQCSLPSYPPLNYCRAKANECFHFTPSLQSRGQEGCCSHWSTKFCGQVGEDPQNYPKRLSQTQRLDLLPWLQMNAVTAGPRAEASSSSSSPGDKQALSCRAGDLVHSLPCYRTAAECLRGVDQS